MKAPRTGMLEYANYHLSRFAKESPQNRRIRRREDDLLNTASVLAKLVPYSSGAVMLMLILPSQLGFERYFRLTARTGTQP